MKMSEKNIIFLSERINTQKKYVSVVSTSSCGNDVVLTFGPAPADFQKPARATIPMNQALRNQFNADMSTLKAWKTAISNMDNNAPGKSALLLKYQERVSELLRNRSSYKPFSRFI